MSVLVMEGFEGLGTTTGSGGASDFRTRMTRRGYNGSILDGNNAFLETGYNSQGYAMSWGATYVIASLDFPLATNQYGKTLVIGFRYKSSDIVQVSDVQLVSVMSSSVFGTFENTQMQVNLVDNSMLRIKRGAVVTLATSAAVISPDTWHHIEWKVLVHPSAGSYDLKVDGVTVLSASGIDTLDVDSLVDRVRFYSTPGGGLFTQVLMDDIWILNSDGSLNNDFLGTTPVIRVFYPDADAGPNQFTPSTGTDHYALVDETDEDTVDYLDGVTATNREAFSMQPVGSGTYKAVMTEALVKVNGAGVRNARHVVESGVTTSNGTTFGVSDADDPVAIRRILETNPDTGLSWTDAGINAAEFGVEVQT